MKEGYEYGASSKDWAVIAGRGERGALERHALGARLFLVRTEAPTSTSDAKREHDRPVACQTSTRFAPGAEFVLSRGEK